MELKSVHALFSGRVQGVGFRYTARELALEQDLTGWVRNLGDGRVELVAEGDEPSLKAFISRIEETFSISNSEIYWEPATGVFRSFTVEF
jgi:acylphosphatase